MKHSINLHCHREGPGRAPLQLRQSAQGMQQHHAVFDHRQVHAPPSVPTGVRQRRRPNLHCRCATEAAQTPGTQRDPPQMHRQRLQQLFSGEAPALLLERSIAGSDAALWEALPFSGQILPDLPMASTWPGLLKATLQRCVS